MQLTALRLALTCDASSRAPAVDRRTGQPPILWRGNAVAVAATVFASTPAPASLVTDWSAVADAALVLRQGSALGPLLASSVVPVASITTTLTYSQWEAGAAHITFPLTGTDTNHAPTSSAALPIYFAIALRLLDASEITVAHGFGEIREDGIGPEILPTIPPSPAVRFSPSGHLELYNPDELAWFQVTLSGIPTGINFSPVAP